VTAEQAKAESVQRSLEEERRVLNMQISMEREELERAKVRPTDIHIGTELNADSTHFHLPYPSCLSPPSEYVAGGAEIGDAALRR